jgi:hypothetical protein
VGHRVQIHNITPVRGKERGDLEIKDNVVLQNPQEQVNRLPPRRTLTVDFTITHIRFGSSNLNTTGQLTHTRSLDGVPESDGTLKTVVRAKILNYGQIYLNRPDPISFMSVVVDTSGHIYDDFSRPLFFHTHREVVALVNKVTGGIGFSTHHSFSVTFFTLGSSFVILIQINKLSREKTVFLFKRS